MKKLLYYTFLGLLAIGCSDEPSENPDLSCVLSSILITEEDDDDTYDISFEYDGSGRISKITEVEGYISGGELMEVTDEFVFTYQNDRLVSMNEVTEGEVEQEVTITYENDKIASVLSEDVDGYAYKYQFVYDGDVVEKLESYYKEGDEFVLDDYLEFSYTGSNLTEVVGLEVDYPDDSETTTYTYDSNKNPFYGNLPLLLWWGEFSWYLSENNVLTASYVEVYGENTYNYDETYSYVLNEEDNVSTITLTDDDYTEVYELAYDCE